MLKLAITMLGRRRSQSDPSGEVVSLKQYLSSARDLLGVSHDSDAVRFLARALQQGRREDGLNALRTAIAANTPFDQLQLPEISTDESAAATAFDESALAAGGLAAQLPDQPVVAPPEGLSPA